MSGLPQIPGRIRETYRKEIADFLTAMEAECARLEAAYCRVRTDEPLEKALIGYVEKRNRMG